MCGFCGIVQFDGASIEQDLLVEMRDTLKHRGPDDAGLYIDTGGDRRPAVGLGHRRLSIIDLSEAGRQPMTNEDGRVVVVTNGEIYNFEELRADLIGRGHRFRSKSDTEVIVHLYEEHGDDFPARLDGMFAIALWDAGSRKLILARDRVGKKPLFYYQDEERFLFGSEMKSLLRHPGVDREINPTAVSLYLCFGYVPTPHTFYRKIFKLPPATRMVVGPDGRREARTYWTLDYSPNGKGAPGENLGDDAWCAGHVRTLLTEAVRKRLVSDVPLGAFLSGGIDSSIVVGIMSRIASAPVKTFSIGFSGDPRYNEVEYARMVADRFRTEHTEFIVKPEAFDLIEKLLWYHDEPYGDSSAIPTYIVSKLTREHVTVALNGDGGDEVFAGYERFQAARMAERLPKWIMMAGSRIAQWIPDTVDSRALPMKAKRMLTKAARPFPMPLLAWIANFEPEELASVCSPDQWARTGAEGIGASFYQAMEGTEVFESLDRILCINFRTYLLDDLLRKMDLMSMANSLEARSPFLDRDLVEFAARMPARMKLRRGRMKYILKRAFSDMLPPPILKRGKMGFGVPLGKWFCNELRDYVCDWLLAPDLRMGAYLRPREVRRIVESHLAQKGDYSRKIWALLMLELWLQKRSEKIS